MNDSESLTSKTIRGIKNNFLLTVFKVIFELGSRIILVRILAPEIFGLMVFAHLVRGFVVNMSTFSSDKALIQRNEVDGNFLNTAVTIEIISSFIGAALLFSFSPFLMSFLERPGLVTFVQALSLTIPISVTALVLRAYMIRVLDFKKANISLYIATPINALVIVILAILGFGIWSFFWGELISSLLQLVILWLVLPIKPRLRLDFAVIKKIIPYGIPLTGSSFLIYFYWNVDDFLVGMILNVEQLGFYWLAFKIPHYILHFLRGLADVFFASFSRTENNLQLARRFSQVTKYSTFIMFLPCAVALVLGTSTIKLFFGEMWLPAVVPFQIFMCLATFRAIFNLTFPLLASRNMTQTIFYTTLFGAVLLPVVGIVPTQQLGIIGMSAVVTLVGVLISFYAIYKLKKIIDVRFIRLLWKNFAAFGTVLLVGYLFLNRLDISVIVYLTNVIIITTVYLLMTYILDRKLLLQTAISLKKIVVKM